MVWTLNPVDAVLNCSPPFRYQQLSSTFTATINGIVKTPAGKGQLGEYQVSKILDQLKPGGLNVEVTRDQSHQSDFHVWFDRSNVKILVEAKNYGSTSSQMRVLPKDSRDRFEEDLDANADCSVGLLVSLHTPAHVKLPNFKPALTKWVGLFVLVRWDVQYLTRYCRSGKPFICLGQLLQLGDPQTAVLSALYCLTYLGDRYSGAASSVEKRNVPLMEFMFETQKEIDANGKTAVELCKSAQTTLNTALDLRNSLKAKANQLKSLLDVETGADGGSSPILKRVKTEQRAGGSTPAKFQRNLTFN